MKDSKKRYKWLESYLFNLKNQNKKVEYKKVLAEFVDIFNLKMNPAREKYYFGVIKKINHRENKKFYRYKERIKELSSELLVPEGLIEWWFDGGFEIRKFRSTLLFLQIVRERDFYLQKKNKIDFEDFPKGMAQLLEKFYL